MSGHAGPPRDASAPVPEPTFAERARTLVDQGRTGALATVSRRRPGHPFASVMPYAPDGDGHPLLLISAMAVHTQNVAADARASLLVAEDLRPRSRPAPAPPGGAHADAAPGLDSWGETDVLAAGRVTLMGEVRRVPGAEAPAARALYLERHPMAAHWIDFGDFALWRLVVTDVYFVGGFGAMGWVDGTEYVRARPDPLAGAAAGILDHMNRDHPEALLAYARFYAQVQADEARMASVDRLGFKLRLRDGRRRFSVRIPFPREVTTAEQSREVLVEMLRRARGGDR